MARLTLLNNLNGHTRSREAWTLHHSDCADLTAEIARGADVETQVDSVAEAAAYMEANYGEDAGYEGGWTIEHVKVQNCTKTGPKAPKPLAAGRCAGSGQTPASKVDMRRVYPTGKCPVCGEYFGAKTGRIAHHNAPKPVVAKPKCGRCGETTRHRSGFCSICRQMAAWGAPGYEMVTQ